MTRQEKETLISIFVDSMTQLHIEHLRNDIDIFLKTTENENGDWRNKTTKKNVADNVAEELTERQCFIITLTETGVAQNVAVNTKYLSEQFGLNRKTIQRDLAVLQERKLIQWIGPDKTGHWVIVKHE